MQLPSMAEERECAVCLASTQDAVCPCAHAVCRECLARWLQTSATCPVCRGVVVATRTHANPSNRKVIHVDFPTGNAHLGITLCTSLRGVRVKSAPDDRAKHAGFRVGDVLTHVNGLPVRTPQEGIAILQRASETQTPVACAFLRRRRLVW